MRTGMIGLALLALPATAHATSWYRVGGNDKTMTYVDADSIKADGDKKTAWVWSVYAAPINDTVYSARVKTEYDCTDSYLRTLEYSYFGEGGAYISTEPSDSADQRQYPPAGSINEAAMAFVCQRQVGDAVSDPLADAAGEFGG